MTPKDTMRAAVEALSLMYANSHGTTDDEISARLRARSALSLLRSALDEGGEPTPVAWLFEGPGLRQLTKAGDFTKPVLDLHKRMALEQPNKYTLTPLYASPIAADTHRAVNPPEFQEATWGVDATMRPCKSMAISEYAFRQWAKDVGIVLATGAASPVLSPAVPATPGGGLSTDGVDLPDGSQR